MAEALFTIIITPLVQIIDACYALFYELSESDGFSIIGLSFVVTICTLPLYIVAERWQQTERDIQKKMKSQIERIKTTFKGDEQYMILTAHYRENHYHPLMALRSSISLIIQIPFFMAAYHYLSNMEQLRGVSFYFIKDLGFADRTFMVGAFPVNVLPIAMTAINIIAGAIYSKGHGKGEKIQIYVSALVFLALLYNSPAGLVVYWTMNNVLSLVKNIFYKIPGLKSLAHPFVVLGNLLDVLLDFIFGNAKRNVVFSLFLVSSCILAVLSSLTIPSMLIESEVNQFCYIENFTTPLVFIRHTFYQALGLFVVWPLSFYFLFSDRTKKTLAVIFLIAALCSIINTFCFSGNYGPIKPELYFMTPQNFKVSLGSILSNFSLLLSVSFFALLLLKKKKSILIQLSSVVLVVLVFLSIKNIHYISSEFAKIPEPKQVDKIEKEYHLSKNGKNVIVIMQDRLSGLFIPHIFENNPDITDSLDGFTYFKNVVSHGRLTMIGSLGIFGGYDFTPFEFNKRTDKTIQQKHNEALLSMPRTFHSNGFSVAVSGLPYENYLEYPLETMYKDDTYISRMQTRGKYSNLWYEEHNEKPQLFLAAKIKRNFIWFSLFKMISPVFRKIIYHHDYWCAHDSYFKSFPSFIDNFSEMYYLPQMLAADNQDDSFILIDNEATHEAVLIDEDTYIPSSRSDFKNSSELTNSASYTTDVAVMKTYTGLINRLKELEVYDNTRIIIVSDHGEPINIKSVTGEYAHIECFIPTLLVKDFNQHGSLKTDYTFMTNADTPWLATKDIIDDARNPFTGNPYKVENKNEWIKICNAPAESTRIRHKLKFTIKDDQWLTVHDDVFMTENWGPYSTR